MNIVRRAVDSLAIVGLWAVLWAVVVAMPFVIVGAMTGAAFAVLLGWPPWRCGRRRSPTFTWRTAS